MFPNFFIIGAPKCGTTSLSSWLSAHPDIFMPAIKEPHFFNFSDGHRNIKKLKDYLNLFSLSVEREYMAVGEASVWYLSSADAVSNILREIPDAKFIVMLRNPLEMAPSLHQQNIYGLYEDVRSFGDAWRLQTDRQKGLSVPRSCRDPRHLYYGDACSLGKQVGFLLKKVDVSQVHFIYFEDLSSNPAVTYSAVLNFLGVRNDLRDDFSAKNSAKSYRNIYLSKVIKALYRLKITMGVSKSFGLDKLNVYSSPRSKLSDNIKNDLISYFSEDIKLLSELTDRDLSMWIG